MKAWWGGISLRERLVVFVAGFVVLYILFDLLVITPYFDQRQQLNLKVEQARDDLEWMRQAVNKIPQQGKIQSKAFKGRIVSFVDGQISRSGFKKNLQQMTPIQQHSVRVRLSEVDFNQLMKFFSAIDGLVIIEEVRIIPLSGSGEVDASMILRNPKIQS